MVLYEVASIGLEIEWGTARIDAMTVNTIKPIHFVENWRKDRRDTYTYEPVKAKIVLQISTGTGYHAELEGDVYKDDEFIEHIHLTVSDSGSAVKEYDPPSKKIELRNVKFSTDDPTANTFFTVKIEKDGYNYVSTSLRGDGKVICELWRGSAEETEDYYWQEHDLQSILAASGAIAAAKAISDIMIQFMSVMIVFSMVILIIRGLIEAFMGAVRL